MTMLPGFEMSGTTEATTADSESAAPRVLEADRRQVLLRPMDLESLLAAEHPARTLWACVSQLDLTAFYAPIAAVEGHSGRAAIDPKLLLTLWLYATSEGIGSARELARLCEAHDAYRWICGGVHVNYHTLSDFRVAHQAALDTLLTQTLAVLLHQGLITLTRVATDGTRVRANAGASSFHREKSLHRCLAAAQAQLRHCATADDAHLAARSARQAAAQARAARDRERRLAQALAELPALRAAKPTADPAAVRVSSTDPTARVMRMGDGGFRPAYSLQVATDLDAQVIVGVAATTAGTERHLSTPMLDAVTARCGRAPAVWLVDEGFVTHAAVTEAAERAVDFYGPVATRRNTAAPFAPRATDSPPVAAWRARMATPAAHALYQRRSETECVHALWKGRGRLSQLAVRGLAKVQCVALWLALAHNLLRWATLEAAQEMAMA